MITCQSTDVNNTRAGALLATDARLAVVRFRVLGPVEMHTGDGGVLTLRRRQERCMLAILLLECGRIVLTERLCALLWEDEPPDGAQAAVRSLASRIRTMLRQGGDPGVVLVSEGRGYRLTAAPEQVDAHLFRGLVDRAAHAGELAERDRLLSAALALWRGPALHRAATDRVRQRLCGDLDEMHLQAIEESLAVGLQLGRHRQMLPEVVRLAAEHPTRDRLIELHMLALQQDGRTADALEVYARARTRLADSLGLDPGPALQRLHTAILRGESVPMPDSAAPRAGETWAVPAQLPADTPGFTGRASHLADLDELLSDDAAGMVIAAIAGTAGVGKTALALHWAHRVRHRFPDGQLYTNLRGFDPVAPPTPPHQALRRFLAALGVPGRSIPAEPDAQLDMYRSMLADKRVLIVLDNAYDAEQVRPLLPGASGCLVVVTSRNPLIGLVISHGGHPLAVDLFSSEEARTYLTIRLDPRRVAAERDAVDDLILQCAHLPLALAIAAAQAATRPDRSLAALVAGLRDARLDALATGDPTTDPRAVFACSYQALTPAAARLFRLLGSYPGTDITGPVAASLTGLRPTEVPALITELAQAHLMTEHQPGRYTLHDLLRAYATEVSRTVDTDDQRRAATHRVLDHYLHTAYAANELLQPGRDLITPTPTHPGVAATKLSDQRQALAWFVVEHANLLATVDHAAATGFDTHAWQLAWFLCVFLDRQGHWHDWATTLRTAVTAAHRLTDPAVQANGHRNLALAYTRLRRFDDAFAELERAVDLYQQAGDLVGQARTVHNIALISTRLNRYHEAIHHTRRSAELSRAAGDKVGEASALNGLGWDLAQIGDYEEAIAVCQEALDLQREIGDRYEQSNTWDSLGYINHHLGQYHQAITCYRNALELQREFGCRYSEAETLANLGDTLCTTGDTHAARDAYQQAVAVFADIDHPDLERVRTKLNGLGG
jgi:DNA-binding SARP family transcriptional activator/tetratricopeptide (TPR) repeat protein